MTVYSKDQGISPRPLSRPTEDRRPAGIRYPSYRQSRSERMQVPPNYSGHAIVDGEERPLGGDTDTQPETAVGGLPMGDHPAGELPTPRFDGLPRISETGESRARPRRPHPASFELQEPSSVSSLPPADEAVATPAPTFAPTFAPSSAPEPAPTGEAATPAPPSETHRPLLGIELGWEEVLLAGLILFLLLENRNGCEQGDLDETVVLLGLLLLLK